MSYHHTRHSFASILAQKSNITGLTLHELKELMGHQTLQMTMRYAHLFPKNEDLIEKLDVLTGQEPEPKINDFLVLLWAVFGIKNPIENENMPENIIAMKKA